MHAPPVWLPMRQRPRLQVEIDEIGGLAENGQQEVFFVIEVFEHWADCTRLRGPWKTTASDP